MKNYTLIYAENIEGEVILVPLLQINHIRQVYNKYHVYLDGGEVFIFPEKFINALIEAKCVIVDSTSNSFSEEE